ncbi:MAG: Stabilization protein [Enterovirga sp.]|jgi:toxin ParE1/3/4|nr:Stabilization protein [Enterovirga sp.]
MIKQVDRHISRFPKLGSPTQDPHLRAMLTLPYPYLLLYEEQAGEAIVHRVRHAARQR